MLRRLVEARAGARPGDGGSADVTEYVTRAIAEGHRDSGLTALIG